MAYGNDHFQAMQDGWTAARKGLPETACPWFRHTATNLFRSAWLEGHVSWMAAQASKASQARVEAARPVLALAA